ncbi:MAG: hypothetical protein A2X13_14430 [Bacteroidetes bacterium GWC2_33_15]|nr:MAG: hypothetical protein A2X10_12475 [Bacteroidetes bacterium GWA2_33_15]OFX50069.1 MAG: hypothetical protein A2X13_14430 [Bacteroidetes bacterium GWC2_33_15]OFX65222.1 MAG: hypothetical protein A2X15_04005 [Bacteroidetes bacterium GWB2_32_14]OFX70448.1 MAG: hypothetical protein A2X14_04060 [Bacteroidetes bacterium GWD2_33_33]HAN19680.1 DUF340 domain-containing protein [Bacteroidales bacterium]
MIIVLSLMSLGIIIGWIFHSRKKFLKLTGYLTNWAIYLLLFLLGISVGANEKIIANFDKIGFQAISLTLFAVGGSILFSWAVYHIFFRKK